MTKILTLRYKAKPELDNADVQAIAKATDTTLLTVSHIREVNGWFGKKK